MTDNSSKYYTPDISEFHYGFEFEVLNKKEAYWIESEPEGKWLWNSVDYGIFSDINNTQRLILDKSIRVKYPDQSDIESLGWTGIGYSNLFYFDHSRIASRSNEFFLDGNLVSFGDYELRINMGRDHLWISIMDFNRDCIFDGIIRNKSELSRLMKQLNIK